MFSNFRLMLNTLPMVLELCSIYNDVLKHLVYNVSKFHKDCFSGFGGMRFFASPLLFLTQSNMTVYLCNILTSTEPP